MILATLTLTQITLGPVDTGVMENFIMAIPEIKYNNLHDSVIVSACFNNKDRLELEIQLYEIYYPGKPLIKLIISGVLSVQKTNSFANDMNNDPCEKDW